MKVVERKVNTTRLGALETGDVFRILEGEMAGNEFYLFIEDREDYYSTLNLSDNETFCLCDYNLKVEVFPNATITIY